MINKNPLQKYFIQHLRIRQGIEMAEESLNRISEILKEAKKRGASDIHLAQGKQVMFRIDGELVKMSEEEVNPFEIEKMIKSMLTEAQMQALEEEGELDFAYSIAGFNRLRVSVFRQRGTYAMALRLFPFEIPDPGKLGIPESVAGLAERKRGLVLVTGAAGSGKTTTLASLIGIIAKKYAKTIITLEDPIEYLHQNNKSMVLQREIGYDSKSYANALRAALRQDPDVILVGEMRDMETMSMVITAAETGHLVFSTLHTNSAASAIDRIIGVFPPYQQQQVRERLAGSLEGIIAQQLLPKQNSGGRIAAFEVMLANPAVRNLIREGKVYQLLSVLQSSRKEGMQTMDDAVYDLYMKSYISSETAISYAQDPIGMMQKVQLF